MNPLLHLQRIHAQHTKHAQHICLARCLASAHAWHAHRHHSLVKTHIMNNVYSIGKMHFIYRLHTVCSSKQCLKDKMEILDSHHSCQFAPSGQICGLSSMLSLE